MLRLSAFAAMLALAVTGLQAQTADLVFFTDDGTKFTLLIDGDVKNSTPATRVVATGIRNESPVVIVRFEDASIPQLKKPGYFPLGMEYTVMITTNQKGERVLRSTGEAALGTAAKAEPEKPKPTTFEEDKPVMTTGTTTTGTTTTTTQGVQQTVGVGGVQQVTTVVVEEEEGHGMGTGTGENVNINMGVNGVGINMNVSVTDPTMSTTGASSTTRTTTTRTTTTTTTTGGTAATATVKPADVGGRPAPAPVPVKEPEVYRMPGYSGKIGCPWPMTATEFADAQKSIESKSFEDTKKTLAQQIAGDRCLTVDQVKGIMALFSFEDTKLEFAKFAYEHTYDQSNYFKVSDSFTYESSTEELNEYIRSR